MTYYLKMNQHFFPLKVIKDKLVQWEERIKAPPVKIDFNSFKFHFFVNQSKNKQKKNSKMNKGLI